jgi:hypothetical protein
MGPVFKRVGEFPIPIANQEANGFRAARQFPGQLASALDDFSMKFGGAARI